jgi:outer membrane protein OmpA-like peptidoglycan-associated protein
MKLINLCLWVALFSISMNSQAEMPLKNASVEDFVERLSPPVSAPKTRSLSRNLVPDSPASTEKPSVDLSIQFEFDSVKLEDQSKDLLDKLAIAMRGNTLARYTFNVEGHTDSVGSDPYNLRLSKLRAQSVVNYLSSRGVDKSRLVAIGKGSTDPLLPEHPGAPENRRVRIIVNT